ncbi:MAG TPA: EamA family transporter [Candidatus Limnocylindrales bacterium]
MPTRAAPAATSRLAIWTGLLVLYVVWGSTYLGIRVAVETIPPFFMAGTRFLIAGAILLAWSIAREGRDFVWPTRRQWRDTTIVGALLLGGGMGMVAWGEQTVPSGIAALLIAMMPVWVAVLGRIFFAERLPRIAVFGVAVGLAGVAILVGAGGSAGGALPVAGLAALLISPICWSSGSLFSSHRAELPPRPLVATGGQMVAGGIVLVVAATLTGELGRLRLDAVSQASLAAFTYLVLVGSLIAFTSYVLLLRIAPLPLIATYAYVNPVVAVILGWLVLQEPLTPRTAVAGAVIVFAVALIITARGRMKPPEARTEALTASGEALPASGRGAAPAASRAVDRLPGTERSAAPD